MPAGTFFGYVHININRRMQWLIPISKYQVSDGVREASLNINLGSRRLGVYGHGYFPVQSYGGNRCGKCGTGKYTVSEAQRKGWRKLKPVRLMGTGLTGIVC